MNKTPHPMIPFLAGWLASAADTRSREAMKMLRIVPQPPDGFEVHLASGLVLRVTVSEIAPEGMS